MGCDIHICMEIKDREGVWKSSELYIKDHYASDGEPAFDLVEVYSGRDYDLFSALCGVRDYSGETPKISDPRGVPNDASQETKDFLIGDWGSDGHSHSWCTLKEMLDFQENNNSVVRSGFISPDAANALDSEGKTPEGWCQGTPNKSWTHRKWTDKHDPLHGIILDVIKQAKKFWVFSPHKRADDIRIVFCFDS